LDNAFSFFDKSLKHYLGIGLAGELFIAEPEDFIFLSFMLPFNLVIELLQVSFCRL